MDTRGTFEREDVIRDPLYGYVGISEVERDIIDSEPLQRLRYITQLGATDRVYPSANHTRFEHSIGVMHLAGRLANSVGLSDTEVTACRLAGLLHDTGHPVWSHTGENVTRGISHEDRSCEIVEQYNLPVDETLVKEYITGNKSPNVVSGVLDADRMDYLLRDSYYTGVSHGNIDVDTLNRFATTIDGKIAIEQKGVPALNRLLNARLQMFQSVYSHENVLQFDAELRRAIHLFAEDNGYEPLFNKRESELFPQLKQYEPFERYLNRNPYPVVKSIEKSVDTNNMYELAEKISESSSVDVSKVLVQSSNYTSFGQLPVVNEDESVDMITNPSMKSEQLIVYSPISDIETKEI